MKAAYIESFGSVDRVQVGEVREPVCEQDEVLIRVKAASLNHRDVYCAKGEAGRFKQPLILGSDGVGTVVKTFAGSTMAIGSRVVIYPVIYCDVCLNCKRGWEHKCFSFGMIGGERQGTLAEYVAVPVCNCIPVPNELPDYVAGSVSVAGLTAWNMIHDEGDIKAGENVLILGASGGVGAYAIRFLKMLGAKVFAVTSKPDKIAHLQALGADEVLSGGPASMLMAASKLPYKGMDAAINFVGGNSWRYVLPAVRTGGQILTCGAVGGAVANMDQRQIFYRQLRIIGSSMGSRDGFRRMLDTLARHPELHIKPAEEGPLDLVPDALKRMEQGNIQGKIIIYP